MADITDEELRGYASDSGWTVGRLAAECLRLRAAKAADKERVRQVVRAAVMASVLATLDQYESPVAQGQYDAATRLIGEKIAARCADALAEAFSSPLAAEQLSGVPGGLSEEERCHLLSILARLRGHGQPSLWDADAEVATLDRLIRLLGASK